jgi:hypothetical protein
MNDASERIRKELLSPNWYFTVLPNTWMDEEKHKTFSQQRQLLDRDSKMSYPEPKSECASFHHIFITEHQTKHNSHKSPLYPQGTIDKNDIFRGKSKLTIEVTWMPIQWHQRAAGTRWKWTRTYLPRILQATTYISFGFANVLLQ